MFFFLIFSQMLIEYDSSCFVYMKICAWRWSEFMKSSFHMILIVGVLFMVCTLALTAQESGEPALKGEPRISVQTEKTPDFGEKQPGGPFGQGVWLVVNLQLEFAGKRGEWLEDDLEVTYRLLLTGRQKNAGKAIVLERTVEYGDVEKGRKCNAAVYVRPAFFLRNFNERPDPSRISYYVEIRYGGRRLKRLTQNARGVPPDWYKSKGLKIDEDSLMMKCETPFAFLGYDYFLYEMVNQ